MIAAGLAFRRMLQTLKKIPFLIKKATAVVTAACFILTGVFGQVLAVTARGNRVTAYYEQPSGGLALPNTIGRITGARDQGSDTVVVAIQDLHCHPQVQQNIADILFFLQKEYGAQSVYLEGTWGKTVDTGWLRCITDEPLRRSIVDGLLGNGELTGAEKFAALAPGAVIRGLENEKLYKENSLRLQGINDQKDAVKAMTDEIDAAVTRVRKSYFNARQNKIEGLVVRHEAGKLESGKYYRMLLKYGRGIGTDNESYPNLKGYVNLLSLEKQIDYKKVSVEIRALLGELRGALPYAEYQTLMKDSGDLQRMDRFYLRLNALVGSRSLSLMKYPALARFFRYLETGKRVDPLALIREERRLINELGFVMAENKSQREVVFLSAFTRVLKDFFANKATAADHEYFTKNYNEFNLLYQVYTGKNTIKRLEPYYSLYRDYYQANIRRNDCFASNILDGTVAGKLDTAAGKGEPEDRVCAALRHAKEIKVVVTGGFHTEGLTALLAQKGVSSLTITPNVTEGTKDSDLVYARVIARQNRVLSNAFAAIALSLRGTDQPSAVISTALLKCIEAFESGSKTERQVTDDLNTMLHSLFKYVAELQKSEPELFSEVCRSMKDFGLTMEDLEKAPAVRFELKKGKTADGKRIFSLTMDGRSAEYTFSGDNRVMKHGVGTTTVRKGPLDPLSGLLVLLVSIVLPGRVPDNEAVPGVTVDGRSGVPIVVSKDGPLYSWKNEYPSKDGSGRNTLVRVMTRPDDISFIQDLEEYVRLPFMNPDQGRLFVREKEIRYQCNAYNPLRDELESLLKGRHYWEAVQLLDIAAAHVYQAMGKDSGVAYYPGEFIRNAKVIRNGKRIEVICDNPLAVHRTEKETRDPDAYVGRIRDEEALLKDMFMGLLGDDGPGLAEQLLSVSLFFGDRGIDEEVLRARLKVIAADAANMDASRLRSLFNECLADRGLFKKFEGTGVLEQLSGPALQSTLYHLGKDGKRYPWDILELNDTVLGIAFGSREFTEKRRKLFSALSRLEHPDDFELAAFAIVLLDKGPGRGNESVPAGKYLRSLCDRIDSRSTDTDTARLEINRIIKVLPTRMSIFLKKYPSIAKALSLDRETAENNRITAVKLLSKDSRGDYCIALETRTDGIVEYRIGPDGSLRPAAVREAVPSEMEWENVEALVPGYSPDGRREKQTVRSSRDDAAGRHCRTMWNKENVRPELVKGMVFGTSEKGFTVTHRTYPSLRDTLDKLLERNDYISAAYLIEKTATHMAGLGKADVTYYDAASALDAMALVIDKDDTGKSIHVVRCTDPLCLKKDAAAEERETRVSQVRQELLDYISTVAGSSQEKHVRNMTGKKNGAKRRIDSEWMEIQRKTILTSIRGPWESGRYFTVREKGKAGKTLHAFTVERTWRGRAAEACSLLDEIKANHPEWSNLVFPFSKRRDNDGAIAEIVSDHTGKTVADLFNTYLQKNDMESASRLMEKVRENIEKLEELGVRYDAVAQYILCAMGIEKDENDPDGYAVKCRDIPFMVKTGGLEKGHAAKITTKRITMALGMMGYSREQINSLSGHGRSRSRLDEVLSSVVRIAPVVIVSVVFAWAVMPFAASFIDASLLAGGGFVIGASRNNVRAKLRERDYYPDADSDERFLPDKEEINSWVKPPQMTEKSGTKYLVWFARTTDGFEDLILSIDRELSQDMERLFVPFIRIEKADRMEPFLKVWQRYHEPLESIIRRHIENGEYEEVSRLMESAMCHLNDLCSATGKFAYTEPSDCLADMVVVKGRVKSRNPYAITSGSRGASLMEDQHDGLRHALENLLREMYADKKRRDRSLNVRGLAESTARRIWSSTRFYEADDFGNGVSLSLSGKNQDGRDILAAFRRERKLPGLQSLASKYGIIAVDDAKDAATLLNCLVTDETLPDALRGFRDSLNDDAKGLLEKRTLYVKYKESISSDRGNKRPKNNSQNPPKGLSQNEILRLNRAILKAAFPKGLALCDNDGNEEVARSIPAGTNGNTTAISEEPVVYEEPVIDGIQGTAPVKEEQPTSGQEQPEIPALLFFFMIDMIFPGSSSALDPAFSIKMCGIFVGAVELRHMASGGENMKGRPKGPKSPGLAKTFISILPVGLLLMVAGALLQSLNLPGEEIPLVLSSLALVLRTWAVPALEAVAPSYALEGTSLPGKASILVSTDMGMGRLNRDIMHAEAAMGMCPVGIASSPAFKTPGEVSDFLAGKRVVGSVRVGGSVCTVCAENLGDDGVILYPGRFVTDQEGVVTLTGMDVEMDSEELFLVRAAQEIVVRLREEGSHMGQEVLRAAPELGVAMLDPVILTFNVPAGIEGAAVSPEITENMAVLYRPTNATSIERVRGDGLARAADLIITGSKKEQRNIRLAFPSFNIDTVRKASGRQGEYLAELRKNILYLYDALLYKRAAEGVSNIRPGISFVIEPGSTLEECREILRKAGKANADVRLPAYSEATVRLYEGVVPQLGRPGSGSRVFADLHVSDEAPLDHETVRRLASMGFHFHIDLSGASKDPGLVQLAALARYAPGRTVILLPSQDNSAAVRDICGTYGYLYGSRVSCEDEAPRAINGVGLSIEIVFPQDGPAVDNPVGIGESMKRYLSAPVSEVSLPATVLFGGQGREGFSGAAVRKILDEWVRIRARSTESAAVKAFTTGLRMPMPGMTRERLKQYRECLCVETSFVRGSLKGKNNTAPGFHALIRSYDLLWKNGDDENRAVFRANAVKGRYFDQFDDICRLADDRSRDGGIRIANSPEWQPFMRYIDSLRREMTTTADDDAVLITNIKMMECLKGMMLNLMNAETPRAPMFNSNDDTELMDALRILGDGCLTRKPGLRGPVIETGQAIFCEMEFATVSPIPGLLLATGRLDEAREILVNIIGVNYEDKIMRSFSAWQLMYVESLYLYMQKAREAGREDDLFNITAVRDGKTIYPVREAVRLILDEFTDLESQPVGLLAMYYNAAKILEEIDGQDPERKKKYEACSEASLARIKKWIDGAGRDYVGRTVQFKHNFGPYLFSPLMIVSLSHQHDMKTVLGPVRFAKVMSMARDRATPWGMRMGNDEVVPGMMGCYMEALEREGIVSAGELADMARAFAYHVARHGGLSAILSADGSSQGLPEPAAVAEALRILEKYAERKETEMRVREIMLENMSNAARAILEAA